MEMDGKSIADIAKAINVPEEHVKMVLEEDPFDVIAH